MRTHLRADVLLAQNIRALLDSRMVEHRTLALWCGHKPPWVSKILNGERGLPVRELGKIADFFGLTVADLFLYGISSMNNRRRRERRAPADRRTGRDRRDHRSDIHPDVRAKFPDP